MIGKNKRPPTHDFGNLSLDVDNEDDDFMSSDIVPINIILINPDNPRFVGKLTISDVSDLRDGTKSESDLNEEQLEFFLKLKELAESIKDNKLIQPITVHDNNGNFELDAGERRLLASIYNNAQTIQIIVRRTLHLINSPKSKLRELTIALNENEQRENLSLRELITTFIKYEALQNDVARESSTEERTLTATDLQNIIHKSLPHCSKYEKIMHGDTTVLNRVISGDISSMDEAYKLAIAKKKETAFQKDHKPENKSSGVNQQQLNKPEKIAESKEEGDENKESSAIDKSADEPVISKGPLKPPTQEEHKRNVSNTQHDISTKNPTHIKLGNINDLNLIKTLLEKILTEKEFQSINWEGFNFSEAQGHWDFAIASLKRNIK